MIYLFGALALVWLAFFAYNAYLVKKTTSLEREIEHLKSFIEEGTREWKSQGAIDPQPTQKATGD